MIQLKLNWIERCKQSAVWLLCLPFYRMQKIRPLCIITSASICHSFLFVNYLKMILKMDLFVNRCDSILWICWIILFGFSLLVCSDMYQKKKELCKMIGNNKSLHSSKYTYNDPIRFETIRFSTNFVPIYHRNLLTNFVTYSDNADSMKNVNSRVNEK